MNKHLAALAIGITLMSIVTVSCGKKGVPTDANTQPKIYIELVSDSQLSLLPDAFSDTIWVRVVNGQGLPVVGDTVNFEQISASNGGGFYFTEPAVDTALVTNQLGYAFNQYRSDSSAGTDTLAITTSSADSSDTAYILVTVNRGAPAEIVKVSPLTPQSSPGGQTVPVPYVVRVMDRFGNVIPDCRVVFRTTERCVVATDSMIGKQYLLDTAYTSTDADGLAQADWILTVNPDPFLGTYPNTSPELHGYAAYNNARVDSVTFRAFATNPGKFKYYNDIRPILIDNCQGVACHSGVSSYQVDFYYSLMENNSLIPGDTTCQFVANLNPISHISDLDMVEEDKTIRWAVTDSAAPGSSGLNSYTGQMKMIFDNGCIVCHSGATPPASYDLTTYAGIKGNGGDATPNAIPGDNSCLLATYMQARHNADSLSLDPTTAAALADSIIRWIVVDSLREY